MHIYFFISLFISSFLLNYFVTTSLFLHKLNLFSNNLNRVYLALYKASWVLIISSLLFHLFRGTFDNLFLIFIFILVIIVFFLARYQVGINDKQYLGSLIQTYSDTILPSKKIAKTTKNPHIKKIAESIINKNTTLIYEAKKLLKKI